MSHVLVSEDESFEHALINHPSYIGKYHSSKYATEFLTACAKTMFQYVIWEKKSVMSPNSTEAMKSFCISYNAIFAKDAGKSIILHFNISYSDNPVKLSTFQAVDIQYISSVSLHNYVATHTRPRTVPVKMSTINKLFTLFNVISFLQMRETQELERYYSRYTKLFVPSICMTVRLLPFNRFRASCTITCFSYEKVHTYECKQISYVKNESSILYSPWSLEKMAAFVVRNTMQDISKLPAAMQVAVLSTRVQYTQLLLLQV